MRAKVLIIILISIVLLASCNKDDNNNSELPFSEITSTKQLTGTWGREYKGIYEYWSFNEDGIHGSYMKSDPTSSSNSDQFEFTYYIDSNNKWLLIYTNIYNGVKDQIGIGIYTNGDLMVGSERFIKLKE